MAVAIGSEIGWVRLEVEKITMKTLFQVVMSPISISYMYPDKSRGPKRFLIGISGACCLLFKKPIASAVTSQCQQNLHYESRLYTVKTNLLNQQILLI